MAQQGDAYFSKSLEKGLKILALFDVQKPLYSQTEIAKALDINMTSAYRFISTLVRLGYLRRDEATKKLRLGLKALAQARTHIRTVESHQIIKSLVDEAHQEHNVTIDVAVAIDGALTIVYRREAENTLLYRWPVISRAWHCTSLGKAFLAFLPPDEAQSKIETLELEPRTPKTITDRHRFAEEISATKKRGFAITDEEFLPGLITLGAPLINMETGYSMGAISFDFSTIQQSVPRMREKYADLIVTLGGKMSKMISES